MRPLAALDLHDINFMGKNFKLFFDTLHSMARFSGGWPCPLAGETLEFVL